MNKELKPVRCGCGGEAMLLVDMHYFSMMCKKCGISTENYDTEVEAVTAWNRAMGSAEKSSTVERTAKVVEGQKGSWYCTGCGKWCDKGEDIYCAHCGCRLEWK